MFETRVRFAVSLALWSASGAVLVALFIRVAGEGTIARTIALVWSASLVLGMVLVWRLPDKRRYLALALESLVLVAGFVMVRHQLELSTENAREDAVKKVHLSTKYLMVSAAIDRKKLVLLLLQNRLASTPADWVQAAARLLREIEEAETEIGGLADQLSELEHSDSVDRNGEDPFDLFGKAYSDLAKSITLLILETATEVLALTLSSPRRRMGTCDAASCDSIAMENAQPLPHLAETAGPTPEDYLTAVRELRATGQPSGYRTVREKLGITEGKARQLLKQLAKDGRLAGKDRYKPPSDRQSGLTVGSEVSPSVPSTRIYPRS